MTRNDRYWNRMEDLVAELAEQGAECALRLRPRAITSLGVCGECGVPCFSAASEGVRLDFLHLLNELTHELYEISPGLYSWRTQTGAGFLGVVLSEASLLSGESA